MAFDAFLKIDGIPGESSDEKHADWIEINPLPTSWNSRLKRPPAPPAALPPSA